MKAELIKVHKDNPFKDEIKQFLSKVEGGDMSKTYTENGDLAAEEITVTFRREYGLPPFTKLYKNKALLEDLSPWACKVLMHIALHLGYNAQRINLTYKKLNMDHRKYSATMIELMSKRIVSRQKPGWYWVNITILIVGKVDKDELDNRVETDTNVPG